MPEASPSPDPPARAGAVFARHQVAAVIATGVDFATMIALVELGVVRPPTGAFIGAMTGAAVNFWLGRVWVYRARTSALGQALRYGLVSLGSAGLNAGLEAMFVSWLGVPYVAARIVGSLAVGLGWNYPLQRYFVYAPRRD